MEKTEEIFISYSWDSEDHKDTVLSFVEFLRNKGFNANIDQAIMQDETAIHLNTMMREHIQFSRKVIVILTQGYKEKADKNIGGVGAEYKYICSDIEREKKKYILVSFQDIHQEVKEKIVPFGLRDREIINLKEDEKQGYKKLFSKLSDEPLVILSDVAAAKPIIIKKEIPEFNLQDKEKEEQYAKDLFLINYPTNFFDDRLSRAFPGVRGIQWYNNPKEIIQRLKVLLRPPLERKTQNNPIWWFRGYQSLGIEKCDFSNEEKYLMNNMECLVDKICVYKSSKYDRSFIYVELKGESPVGVYKYDEEYISRLVAENGYAKEEYGIYKGITITREEYDDAAKFIDGKLVEFNMGEASLRVRCLSKYNFIICAMYNPINSSDADVFLETYLKNMLDNIGNVEEIVKFVENLPRHKNNY